MGFFAWLTKRWTSGIVQPFDGPHTSETCAFDATESWQQRLPQADITGTIGFSKTRCLMSLVSLALLVTDIPRTGLGVQSISDFFPERAAPDTAIRFGPYAYPVAHIACAAKFNSSVHSSEECQGLRGDTKLSRVGAWVYGYDTTSVGIRSVAQLFNASSFPEFLLNRGTDPRRGIPGASISLEEAFDLIDSIIDATERQVIGQSPLGFMKSIAFASRFSFIDRLHDHLLKFFSARERVGGYVLQVLSKQSRSPLEFPKICKNRSSSNRPAFCDHEVAWLAENPTDGTQRPEAIWDHVFLRAQALQKQYPDLWLDFCMLSMQQLIRMRSITQATIYDQENGDLVVLVRGRACSTERTKSNAAACRTVFVDDFRYERYLLTTNVAEWYSIAAALRGVAQLYVWTRLVLLLYASCAVQPRQYSIHEKFISAAKVIVRIPFQVVVYGSSIPVACYVIAHLIDGNFVDTYLDVYWASIGGTLHSADIVGFVRVASVQMRNVWLLALLAKLRVLTETRRSRWRIDLGVNGVRGLAISFTSFISIFGPYRSILFRNSDVVEVILLGDVGSSRATRMRLEAPSFQNIVRIGDGTAMTFAALGTVLIASVFVQAVLGPRSGAGILFAPSVAIPHAAGRLWSLSALGIRFHCSTVESNPVLTIAIPSPTRLFAPEDVDSIHPTHLVAVPARSAKWRRMLNVIRTRNALLSPVGRDLLVHTVATKSLVQLMNITMMSDPWTLVQLAFVGRHLYVYEVRQADHQQQVDSGGACVYILPYPFSIVGRETGVPSRHCKLIATLSSRDIPFSIMLNCA